MDTDTITRILGLLLPPQVTSYIHQHALRPDAPLQIYLAQAKIQAIRAADKAYPYIQPQVERLVGAMEGSPTASSVVVPLLILATAFVVLNWIRRMVMWWTRMALRAVFWATVVALAAWVWNRGVEESVRDAVVLGGKVVGYLAVVKDIWVAEYQRYEKQGGKKK